MTTDTPSHPYPADTQQNRQKPEDTHAIAADVRGIAKRIEDNAPVTAIATGLPVIAAVVQTALFDTLITGFTITLAVILGILVALYA